MSGERHPCDYCGTMLDEDDCVESDIPAVNGPMLHSATQCREYVYACLVSLRAEVDRLRAVVSVARWIQADLKANEGRVSIEREADLDDALIDLEVGAASRVETERAG